LLIPSSHDTATHISKPKNMKKAKEKKHIKFEEQEKGKRH
jgi:hypothetical protein